VGRLVPIKRVDVLLEAVAHARKRGAGVRLAIVGDGEKRTELEQLARELDIVDHVAFVGYRSDMVEVAAASDLAVLSSDNEGTPVSLIEGAAAGTAAAATDVGGVADVVTPETGVLVPRGDSVALGEAVASLASDAARRRELGAAAQAWVSQRFSVQRLVDDIERLYEELLADPPRTSDFAHGTRQPLEDADVGSRNPR
jgi:glycosyltransferase involved in cell wall biosynthesis